jgi:D-citramalate synthase
MHIEVMDTTLRDGEQMSDVSFAPHEKLSVAKLLLTQLKVDRIEVASAKVSKGEAESVKAIMKFAENEAYLNSVEVLGFVDKNVSVDWIKGVGGRVINLLTKGSLLHCEKQLNKKPAEHFEDIKKTINYAYKNKFIVNVYLEDWSNGMINSPEYVFDLVRVLKELDVKRIMLPDTLGVLNPLDVLEYASKMVLEFSDTHFDFHAHNDYGLATANTLAAVKTGVKGVHGTINGMGERAGNASIDEVCTCIKDFMTTKSVGIDEKKLYLVSSTVEMYSGHRLAGNKPIMGEYVFTQTSGIHADGDKKGNLYISKLTPERFARERTYALGKMSGKSNLEYNLKQLGIELSEEERKKVLEKVIKLGDMKKSVTASDLPYIIEDVLEKDKYTKRFKIINLAILSTKGLKPTATVAVKLDDHYETAASEGDGGYDAFMKSIKIILARYDIKIPKLTDYKLSIPPGGNTDALVEATVSWKKDGKTFKTRGINPDQVMAAVEATEKMINQALLNMA